MAEPTEDHLAILMHAVTLSRNENIRSLDQLRSRLSTQGYDPLDVQAALFLWAEYEREKKQWANASKAA